MPTQKMMFLVLRKPLTVALWQQIALNPRVTRVFDNVSIRTCERHRNLLTLSWWLWRLWMWTKSVAQEAKGTLRRSEDSVDHSRTPGTGVIMEGEGVSIPSPSTMFYYIYLGTEIDNQGRDPMNNYKDCRVGRLSSQYKNHYHDRGNHANWGTAPGRSPSMNNQSTANTGLRSWKYFSIHTLLWPVLNIFKYLKYLLFTYMTQYQF